MCLCRTLSLPSVCVFTDYDAENSCTAGRSFFITGQTPLRTGLTKIGASVGIKKRDITFAQALKSQGYATVNSARTIWATTNKDEYLPTNQGKHRTGRCLSRSTVKEAGESLIAVQRQIKLIQHA